MPQTTEHPVASPVHQIGIFLALLVVFSATSDFISIHLAHPNPMTDRFIMWCPAFAAFLTCAACRIDLATLGWRWPAPRWLVLAYVVPLLYAAPVYLVAWMIVPGSFDPASYMHSVAESYNLGTTPVFGTFVVGLPLTLTVGMIASVTWALGEEIGWRGFLLPCMASHAGYTGASLIVGLIWAVWHYPTLLFGTYNAGTNAVYAVACFTVSVVAISFAASWLRLRTQSVWPCALIHASHNTFVQSVFDPLTANTGVTRYITTEFGAGLAIAIGITGYLFWARRGRLATQC